MPAGRSQTPSEARAAARSAPAAGDASWTEEACSTAGASERRAARSRERLRERAARADPRPPEGASLPTERELCADARRLARDRPRTCCSGLEAEQRIYRRQGKGTFVARAKIEQRLGLTSHTEEMRASGIVPGSKLINVSRDRRPSAEVAAALRLARRRRGAADRAAAPRRRRADRDRGPLPERGALRRHHRPRSATTSPSTSCCTPTTASSSPRPRRRSRRSSPGRARRELLDCGPGSALLLLSRLTLDTRGSARSSTCARSTAATASASASTSSAHAAGRRARRAPLLRPATAADAAALAAVFVAAWRDALPGRRRRRRPRRARRATRSPAGSRRSLASPASRRSLAESPDGSVVGFVRFGDDPDDSAQRPRLRALRPPRRRRPGHRPAAARARPRRARGRRVTPTVTLWVFEANERARRVLRRGRASCPTARGGSSPSTARNEIRLAVPRRAARATARERAPEAASAERSRRRERGRRRGRRARSRRRRRARSPSCSTRRSPAASRPGVTLARRRRRRASFCALIGGCVVHRRRADRDGAGHDLRPRVADEGRRRPCRSPRASPSAAPGRSTTRSARWLPGFPRADITLRQLLTHTSGLVPPPRVLPPRPAARRRSARPSTPRRSTPSRARSTTATSTTCCSAGRSRAAPARRSTGSSPRRVAAPLGMERDPVPAAGARAGG